MGILKGMGIKNLKSKITWSCLFKVDCRSQKAIPTTWRLLNKMQPARASEHRVHNEHSFVNFVDHLLYKVVGAKQVRNIMS